MHPAARLPRPRFATLSDGFRASSARPRYHEPMTTDATPAVVTPSATAAAAPRRPLAAILTLGCKLNLADSNEIGRELAAAGYDVIDHLAEADAVVVNTCSVTHVADQKSRRLIRSWCGALPSGRWSSSRDVSPGPPGESRVRELGADFVAGTRDADKADLIRFITASRPAVPADPALSSAPPSAQLSTRAFVKAQEGCNDVCAFCIVPRTRHREESRSIERVVAEVRHAVEAEDAREVVITGTQLGAWGRDLDPPLAPHHLIAGILEHTEVARLRFSSLQPQDITPELLGLWSDPRLMPHFHLALQSGSEATLKSMRRRYTAAEYRDAVARIRAAVPGAAITTDVIAGFPGESEEDFEATLRLCDELSLSRIHAFPYSQRSGTLATRLPGQLSPEVKKARMQRLLALANELQQRHAETHAGETRPVLWEAKVKAEVKTAGNTSNGSHWHGYTDNYIAVYAPGEGLHNRITPVRLGGHFRDGVLGHPTGATHELL